MIHNLDKKANGIHYDKNTSGLNSDNVQGAIDELNTNVEDVQTKVNRLYDIEKISYNQNVDSSSSAYRNVYGYTAKKKCLVHATMTAIYTGAKPKGVMIENNSGTISVNASSDGAISTSATVILDAKDTLYFKAKHETVTQQNNNIIIQGYVQYLE